jgi:hypothetical protein
LTPAPCVRIIVRMTVSVESSPRDAWERAGHGRALVVGSLRWLAATAARVADAFAHSAIVDDPQRHPGVLWLAPPDIQTRAASTAWDDFVVLVAVGWRAMLRPWWARKLGAEVTRALEGTTSPGSIVRVRIVRSLP